MRRLRLLLDAGALVDAPVRDVVLALAEVGLVEFRWTDEVLDGVRSILVDDMARPAPAADRLCDAIRGAFPLGEVTSSDEALAARLAGTDPEGLHPLVAAVTAEADLLVSHERRRFPDDRTLARWDLAVVSPEAAVVELVEALGADAVAGVLAGLGGAQGMTAADVFERLRALGQVAPAAAVAIGAELDAGEADEMDGYLLASRPDEARAVVSALVDRVGDGDLVGMDALLSEAGRLALGPTARLRQGRLQDLLFDVLVDPGAWSVADARAGTGASAARRAAGDGRPAAEVVRLVRTGAPSAPPLPRPGAAAPAPPTTRRAWAPGPAGGSGPSATGPAGDELVAAVDRLEDAGRAAAEAAAGPLARRLPSVTFAVVATVAGWRVDAVTGSPG